MSDIYFVSYQRSNGELVFTTIAGHCRLAAINQAVLDEARDGHDIVCGVAELLCPAALLSSS
ncbi:MAG: hypothetical protein M5U25_20480 [Planctomycetota bacterium]|nr:hypothetical protein [Planctomycetota bacterium]